MNVEENLENEAEKYENTIGKMLPRGDNQDDSNFVLKFAMVIVAVFFSFLVVTTFVFEVAVVRQTSMENTLYEGDVVGIIKITQAKPGDIVVIEDESGKYIIKRLIGMPGDIVSIKNGQTIRKFLSNGEWKEEKLDDSVLKSGLNLTYIYNSQKEYTVPEGKVFLLGDNRLNSRDSSENGAYDMKSILGVMLFKF